MTDKLSSKEFEYYRNFRVFYDHKLKYPFFAHKGNSYENNIIKITALDYQQLHNQIDRYYFNHVLMGIKD